jgi:hypothetical protein
MGRVPDQHTAINERASGFDNPTLVLFAKDATNALLPTKMLSRTAAALAVGIWTLASLFLLVKASKRSRPGDEITLFYLTALVVLILLPRLKPYAFVYALVPLWYLLKDRPIKVKAAVLTASVLLPFVAFQAEDYHGLVRIVAANLQLLSLAGVTAYLLVHHGWTGKDETVSTPSSNASTERLVA